MKFVWLPITAALFATHVIHAEERAQQQLSDKDLSPKKVTEIYADRDFDAVSTRIDQCQNSKLDRTVNSIGCELDSDQDGIYDSNDQCPNTPTGTNVNFLGCEADSDYDGVINSHDQCPLTPLGTKVDTDGCKIIGDADSDGVKDDIDQCPTTPAGVTVNQHGCQPRTSLLVNIVFDTDSFQIRPDQAPLLESDLNTLKDLLSDEIIVITGHTDSVASEASNMRLSWNRANMVKQYLITHSEVEASRIYLEGKGESMPIADNASSSGRQQNRRIVLEVMTIENRPQSAVLQPPQ